MKFPRPELSAADHSNVSTLGSWQAHQKNIGASGSRQHGPRQCAANHHAAALTMKYLS
jgi:hypothetical protein